MTRTTELKAVLGRALSRKATAKDRQTQRASVSGKAVIAAGERSVAADTIQNATIIAGDRYRVRVVLSEVADERLREHFLPLLFTAIAISLTTDVTRRFFGGDGHWLDAATTIVEPVLIALAAGAAALICISVLRPALPVVSKATDIGVFKNLFKFKKTTVMAGIALVIAVGLRLSLPIFAHLYNEKGVQFYYGKPPDPSIDLSRAQELYQKALRLTPSYSPAHYNLALVYEDMHDENAIKEYLLAIKYDSHIYPAYNNLARLYLLRGNENDYENALTILGQARELSPQDENVQYSLNKNLGWANYALQHYQLAEVYLRKAISLREQKGAAAAHCLLAYVLKEQRKAGVADECFDCVSLAPGEKDVEAQWVSDAQECLMKGKGK